MSSARQAWRRSTVVALLLGVALLAACSGATPTTTTRPSPPAGAATATTGGTAARTPTPATTAASAAPTSTTGAAPASASPAAQSAVPAPANAPRYAIVPNDSTATYRVQETFVGQGIHTAVGSTGAVAGDLYLDLSNPAASTIGTITVDISTLASDSSQRDNQIRQRFLESNKYPTATFVPKRLEGLPDTPYTDGQALAFTIVGDLTIRDVTKEVTWAATGKLDGDTFTGSATTQFNMTDFGFDPPEIAGLLKAENGVALELTIVARRAA